MNEFYAPKNVAEYEAKTLSQMQYKGYKNAIRSTWVHTMGLDMSPSLKNLKNTKVHLIWGKNDPLVPYKAAEAYQKLVTTSTLDVIDQAGHLSCYEQSNTANELIHKYLNE